MLFLHFPTNIIWICDKNHYISESQKPSILTTLHAMFVCYHVYCLHCKHIQTYTCAHAHRVTSPSFHCDLDFAVERKTKFSSLPFRVCVSVCRLLLILTQNKLCRTMLPEWRQHSTIYARTHILQLNLENGLIGT